MEPKRLREDTALPVGLEPEESISQGTRDQLPRLLHMKVMGEDTPERLGRQLEDHREVDGGLLGVDPEEEVADMTQMTVGMMKRKMMIPMRQTEIQGRE